MTTNLYIILAALCWTHFTGIPQRFKWAFKKRSIKPFDCELCLSFWGVMANELYHGEVIYLAVLKGLTAGLIASLLFHILRLIKIL